MPLKPILKENFIFELIQASNCIKTWLWGTQFQAPEKGTSLATISCTQARFGHEKRLQYAFQCVPCLRPRIQTSIPSGVGAATFGQTLIPWLCYKPHYTYGNPRNTINKSISGSYHCSQHLHVFGVPYWCWVFSGGCSKIRVIGVPHNLANYFWGHFHPSQLHLGPISTHNRLEHEIFGGWVVWYPSFDKTSLPYATQCGTTSVVHHLSPEQAKTPLKSI